MRARLLTAARFAFHTVFLAVAARGAARRGNVQLASWLLLACLRLLVALAEPIRTRRRALALRAPARSVVLLRLLASLASLASRVEHTSPCRHIRHCEDNARTMRGL